MPPTGGEQEGIIASKTAMVLMLACSLSRPLACMTSAHPHDAVRLKLLFPLGR